jgi:hypothetical protein
LGSSSSSWNVGLVRYASHHERTRPFERRAIESKFPHHVDVTVPEGGFGSRLNAMHDWHDAHSIEAVRGQRENGRDIIRWCFADLVTAALFNKDFGAAS